MQMGGTAHSTLRPATCDMLSMMHSSFSEFQEPVRQSSMLLLEAGQASRLCQNCTREAGAQNIPLLRHARHVWASQTVAPGQGLIPKAVNERLVQLMAHYFLRSCSAPCWCWPRKAPTWLSGVCSAGVGVGMRRTRLLALQLQHS